MKTSDSTVVTPNRRGAVACREEGPRLKPLSCVGLFRGLKAAATPVFRRPYSTLLFCACLVCIVWTPLARAQGGPPFKTDDPDTPGNRQWEINFGLVGTRNPAAGSYQLPDVDINYGLGERIQLKYEIPLALQETRPQVATGGTAAQPGLVVGGLGESYPGIKWRFYEHHPGEPLFAGRFGTGLLDVFRHRGHAQTEPAEGPSGVAPNPPQTNFSVSTYPQLYLDNPTRSVPRGVVPPGPNLLLPIEFNTRMGPVRVNGEFGYYFGNHASAQGWIRGLLVGHEFSERTEAYAEIYDQQDATTVNGEPKQRQTTLGAGGRQALNKAKTANLLLMGGRSFQRISAENSQPSWIAYVGVQVLFGPKDAGAK